MARSWFRTFVLLLSIIAVSQSVLVQLPGHPDPNTDVLFNMQTRRMEETIFLAKETAHVLVEPYYLFGARNWSWFESGHNNQVRRNADISEGILGTIEEPLSTFFSLPPIEAVLGQPVLALHDFALDARASLDLLVRFYGKDLPPCSADDAAVDAFGVAFAAKAVRCTHASEFPVLADFVALLAAQPAVGVLFLPPKFVELRFGGWRQSERRWEVRAALEWSLAVTSMADAFIATHLASDEEEWEGGAGGLLPYLGVHWRRGDRAYREEMGVHGFVDVALTAPRRLVSFVQEVASMHGGASSIFLATNCGDQDDLAFVQENLGVVTWVQSGDWRRAALEAVAEQVVLSRASVVVVPPGVGNPPNVEDTSNFALFALEQRRIDAHRRGAPEPPPWHLCCGASPVFDLWRPLPRAQSPRDAPLEFEVWAAFLPPGAGVMLRVEQLESVQDGAEGSDQVAQARAVWAVPVAHPGRVTVVGLSPGAYVVTGFVRGADGDEEEAPPTPFTVATGPGGGRDGLDGEVGAVMASVPLEHVVEGIEELARGGRPGTVQTRASQSVDVEWVAAGDGGGAGSAGAGVCARRCLGHGECVGVLVRREDGGSEASGGADEQEGGGGETAGAGCGLMVARGLQSVAEELTCRGHGSEGAGAEWAVLLKVLPDSDAMSPITTSRCLPLHYVCMYAS